MTTHHGRVLIGLAAALLLTLIACEDGGEAPAAAEPPAVSPAEVAAEEIATSFADAYGALDAQEATSHLAADAAILDLIGSVGAHRGIAGTPDELGLLISFLSAAGYQQTLDPCEAQGTFASGTVVHCPFDFQLFGSDRLGLGPYDGSSFELTVLDGVIVRAAASFDVTEFSPQMWEPIAEWVSTNHPDDVALMYESLEQTGVRLTEESVALWERRLRQYLDDYFGPG